MDYQIITLKKQLFEIQVKVEEDGKLPIKAHYNDAGFDVYATSDITIYPGQVIKHPLNIRVKMPADSYLSIESKSGHGSKGLLVYAGVIDTAYRGVVHAVFSHVKLVNDDGTPNTSPITIKKGEKLAQCIPFPFSINYFVTGVDSLDMNTSRGETGFGDSGKL